MNNDTKGIEHVEDEFLSEGQTETPTLLPDKRSFPKRVLLILALIFIFCLTLGVGYWYLNYYSRVTLFIKTISQEPPKSLDNNVVSQVSEKVSEQSAREKGIVVLSDFGKYPIIKESLKPLLSQWEGEGMTVLLVDVAETEKTEGRDLAEKTRSFLREQYQQSKFKYLFIVDVQRNSDSGGRHVVPARVLTDTYSNPVMKMWSDYYYSDLTGEFDLNRDKIFTLIDDYQPGSIDDQVIVGRMLLEDSNLEKQLERYVKSDLEYRKKKRFSQALVIKHRKENFRIGSSYSWPLNNESEEKQTLDQVLLSQSIQKKELIASESKEVISSFAEANLIFFWGHGSINSQQIKSIDPKSDSQGTYLFTNDLQNVPTLKNPAIVFFQGCETGKMFLEDFYPDCLDSTVCFSTSTIAQSLILNKNEQSLPAVASVANSISGTSYPVDYADFLQGAFWYGSLAEYINLRNRWSFAEENIINRWRMSLIYFGDPTLSFYQIGRKDTELPTILFSEKADAFVALDSQSGIGEVKISWDGEPFQETTDYPSDPHYLPSNKVFDENHVLRVQVEDRAGNVAETEKIYKTEGN